MKCDDCRNLLPEYIDGEAIETEAEQITAHLITCARCSSRIRIADGGTGNLCPL